MELDSLMKYLIFTNEEKRSYMEMMMYCIGLKYQQKVIDSVTTLCTCEELAERFYLDEKEAEKLYYAAVIHDGSPVPEGYREAARYVGFVDVITVNGHYAQFVGKEIVFYRKGKDGCIVTVKHEKV